MSKIIRFPIERTQPRAAHARRAAGEIILFPGVRYEYLKGADAGMPLPVSRRGQRR